MDLEVTPQDRHFRQEVADWLRDNIPRDPRPPEGGEARAFDCAWQRKQYDGGWAGISWPLEYGGRGFTAQRQFIWHEEYAKVRAPHIGMSFIGINHAGPILILEGDAAHKTTHLGPILRGDAIWCQGFSEPNAGSDLASLQTKGVIDGEYLVVTGQKVWTSYGQFADYQELLVRTDPKVGKHQGISWVICDMRLPGIDVRPLELMSGGTHFCEVFYDEVRIPLMQVVGGLNGGWRVSLATLAFERGTSFIADQLELAYKVEALIRYAKEHPAPGGGKCAYEDDEIRRSLAMVRAEVAAMRAMTLATISRIETDGKPGPEASMIRLYFSTLYQRILRLAMEILGPSRVVMSPLYQGFTHPYLRQFCATIAGGSAQIQREIIAGRVLGLPRSR